MWELNRRVGPADYTLFAGVRRTNPTLRGLIRYPLPEGCSVEVRPSFVDVDRDDTGLGRAVRGLWSIAKLLALLGLARVPGLRDLHPDLRVLSECEALVGKGGHYIYARGGVKGYLALWLSLAPALLAQARGIPVLLLGVTLGPFESERARQLAIRVLSRCSSISVRDQASFDLLRTLLGEKGNYHQVTDLAFGIHVEPLSRPAQPRLFVNLRGSDPSGAGSEGRWQRTLADVLMEVQKARPELDFVPLVTAAGTEDAWEADRSSEDDRLATMELLHLLGREDLDRSFFERFTHISPFDTAREIQDSRGGIAVRFHGGILSLLAGRPCVLLDYFGTKAQTFRALGLGDWVTSFELLQEPDERTRVVSLLTAFVDDPERYSDRAREAALAAMRSLSTDPSIQELQRLVGA
jgi:polysaccharide pyruvyl transferase WcaK-like protein